MVLKFFVRYLYFYLPLTMKIFTVFLLATSLIFPALPFRIHAVKKIKSWKFLLQGQFWPPCIPSFVFDLLLLPPTTWFTWGFPTNPGIPYMPQPPLTCTYFLCRLYAHGAILAALYQREKTGRGQKIECNLLSTQVILYVQEVVTHFI